MPTARADTVTTYANTAVRIAVLGNDSGASLTILSVTTPGNGTAQINSDRTITYTPISGYTGTDTFRYTIRDAGGAKASTKVTVTVLNRVPIAAADAAVTDAGTPVTIAVLANDSDPDGHALKVNAVTQPANGTVAINADRTVTYTPAAGFVGSDAFTYTAGDGHGGTAKATVSVTVRNRPPVPGDDVAATVAGMPVDIAVLANDSDPDGHALSVGAVSQPAGGTVAINPDQTVTYRPQPGYTGSDAFAYTVTDGRGGSAQGAVTVTVRNRAPLAVDDAAATDAGVPVDLAVLANDGDPDGHPLGIAAVGPPVHGTAVASPDGTIHYTPAPGFTGTDVFAYTVADGQGGTSEATVTVTVRNRAPVAVDDTAATDAGTPVSIDLLANDSDPDGHGLRIAAVGSPAQGTVAITDEQTIAYTPSAGFIGSDAFSYTLDDGHGGTAQATVTIEVRNRLPVAGDDLGATDAGVPVDLAVLANDDDPDGHALAIAAVGQPSHGTAFANGDGTIRYLPDAGYTGADSFSYTLADGHGGSAQGVVTLTVRNRAPVAGADMAATDAYATVTLDALANDLDPDGHGLNITSVTQPANGTAAIVGGQMLSYAPRPGFMGSDGFSYTVADGHGGSTDGTVTITVRGWGEPFGDGTFFTDATGWRAVAA